MLVSNSNVDGKSVEILGIHPKARGRDDKGVQSMVREKFPCDGSPNAADPLITNKSPAMIMPSVICCISAMIFNKSFKHVAKELLLHFFNSLLPAYRVYVGRLLLLGPFFFELFAQPTNPNRGIRTTPTPSASVGGQMRMFTFSSVKTVRYRHMDRVLYYCVVSTERIAAATHQAGHSQIEQQLERSDARRGSLKTQNDGWTTRLGEDWDGVRRNRTYGRRESEDRSRTGVTLFH